MYDWLADALGDAAHLVTASRRLARTLHQEHAQHQLAAGKSAWKTPTILAWPDWLAALVDTSDAPRELPLRINAQQSRLLWERALRREISDPLLNIDLLTRQSKEAWSRLHDWRVPLDECRAAAVGRDKRLFVSAATNYRSMLVNESWIDDAGLPTLARQLIDARRVSVPSRVTFAGFDRIVPEVQALIDSLSSSGCRVEVLKPAQPTGSIELHCYDNATAEMRAAGAWARKEFERAPKQKIAIVAPNLEQEAERSARLIREGLLPGWQVASPHHAGVINVSYGRTLDAYPAIAIGLLALRWLCNDLSTPDVSVLLRTPIIGLPDVDERSKVEVRLRQMPDRPWAPQSLVAAAEEGSNAADAMDWLQRVGVLSEKRAMAPRSASPAVWAEMFDEVLDVLNWPGEATLDSREFQLVNRWRELLNDLARFALIKPKMSVIEAHGRLASLARETVFQPESDSSVMQLLGPLEAAGMQFDQLWITGFTSGNWPPVGKPLSLVSRDLQRAYRMPDADPGDTLDYAQRVASRLAGSARKVVVSYPLTDGDAEQTPSALIGEWKINQGPGPADPGWSAAQLVGAVPLESVASDTAPPVRPNETVSGGAMTIQRQCHEPFAAFVHGRLGVRLLGPITAGLAANVRGNLIHDTLHQLYADRPASETIRSWSSEDRRRRIAAATSAAFRPYERFADPVLGQLLRLETQRVRALLDQVVDLDSNRNEFQIAGVENSVCAAINGVRLKLRFDRVDLVPGGAVILDYKSGSPKRLLDRDGAPNDMQLVAYSLAVSDPVAGIGLMHIDSRSVTIDAAGPTFTPDLDWPTALSDWQEVVNAAAAKIATGDVRLRAMQPEKVSRALGLLSRYRELKYDA